MIDECSFYHKIQIGKYKDVEIKYWPNYGVIVSPSILFTNGYGRKILPFLKEEDRKEVSQFLNQVRGCK